MQVTRVCEFGFPVSQLHRGIKEKSRFPLFNGTMDSQYPRINGAQMAGFLGRSVMLIGEVVNQNQERHELVIRAPDSTEVIIQMPMGEFADGRFVQIMGKVGHGNTIEAIRVTTVSSNFDMPAYDKALSLMNGACSDLFV